LEQYSTSIVGFLWDRGNGEGRRMLEKMSTGSKERRHGIFLRRIVGGEKGQPSNHNGVKEPPAGGIVVSEWSQMGTYLGGKNERGGGGRGGRAGNFKKGEWEI